MEQSRIDSITKYQSLTTKTFKPHDLLGEKEAELLDWTLGLPGEVGEVCEIIKHYVFHHEKLDKMALAKEIGDVFWYLAALCTTLNIPIDSVLALNYGKLAHRYANKSYDPELSAKRHENEIKFNETEVYQQIKEDILALPDRLSGDKFMNIIFIGPDGGGKTTISTRLAERLDLGYYKCTYREGDKFRRARQLIMSSENTIFDRFYYPDEIVYSKVKGYAISVIQETLFYTLEPLLLKRNFVFVYVTAKEPILMQRSVQWADDYVETKHLHLIINEYERFLKETNVPVIRVDTSDTDPEASIRYIERALSDVTKLRKE